MLGLLPWWSYSTPFGGVSFNGFSGAGWLFGIASLSTVLLMVVPTLRKATLGGLTAKNAKLVLLGLAALTFCFGPLRELLGSQRPDIPAGLAENISAGKTLWFVLALCAAGAAVAGAFLSLRKDVSPD